MTEEQIALARRAVACKGWKWMPGMEFDLHGAGHLSGGWRIQSVQMRALDKWSTPVRTITAGPCEFIIAPRGGIYVKYVDQIGHKMPLNPSAATLLPFLEDPATRGCLLALVREAWGDDEAYAIPWHDDDGGWTVAVNDDDGTHNIAQGDSEVEALIDALEAAP